MAYIVEEYPMRKQMLLIALALLGVTGVSAEEAWVNDHLVIDLRGWWTHLDAESSRITNWGGGKLNLDSELGLDDEITPEIGLRWQFSRRNALALRYNYLHFEGDEFRARGVTLDNRSVPLFAQIESDAEMHFLRLDWRREWLADKSESFDFETSLGVLGFDLSGQYEAFIPGFGFVGDLGPFSRGIWSELLDQTLPDYLGFLNTAVYQDDGEDVQGALPVVGVGVEWRPGKRFSLKADISGMYAGDYGEFFDAEASVGYALTTWFELHGGYRYWHVNVEDDDDDYKVVMSGPYVGGTFRF
jgi:hypothetical protein